MTPSISTTVVVIVPSVNKSVVGTDVVEAVEEVVVLVVDSVVIAVLEAVVLTSLFWQTLPT